MSHKNIVLSLNEKMKSELHEEDKQSVWDITLPFKCVETNLRKTKNIGESSKGTGYEKKIKKSAWI